MKKITHKEAQEKYGIIVSAMQRLDKIKFFLKDNGEVVDSLGDVRYSPSTKEKRFYKIEFIQREKYVVDVEAENEEEARTLAEAKWNEGGYQETGDTEVEIDTVYDVTGSDDEWCIKCGMGGSFTDGICETCTEERK